MKTFIFLISILCLFSINVLAHEGHDHPQEIGKSRDLIEGSGLFRTCFYCHSLKPGVHLTGPSLANVWGKKAGRVEGFSRYTKELQKNAKVWNESNLTKFLKEPKKAIPGTSMTFEGLQDPGTLKKLVDFLKVAMGPSGYDKVIESKLLDQQTADGQLPKKLKDLPLENQVTEILHCNENYNLTFANGVKLVMWELNLDFKVDSSESGPLPNKPVRMPTGSMGDRFAVVFNNIDEMGKAVKKCPSDQDGQSSK